MKNLENGRIWENVRKCYGSKRAVRPDDKYVLVNMNINLMVFMEMAKTG